MATCPSCGAHPPEGAKFCPRCGDKVAPAAVPPHPAAATAPPVRPARPQRNLWWVAPAIVVALVLIAWIALAFLPLDKEEEGFIAEANTETIAEGSAPAESGTLIEIPGSQTTTQPPVILEDPTATIGLPVPTATAVQPVPAPVPTAPPVNPPLTETPPPMTSTPPEPKPRSEPRPREREDPEPAPRRSELTEGQAAAALRAHLVRTNRYEDVPDRCLEIRGIGRDGDGYGFRVWDTCVRGGGSRLLGRFRIDATTGEAGP